MFNIIKNIISNPVWAISITIILWFITYHLLIFFKFSEANWKRLEYIWLFIGLFGLLSLLEKNNKEFKRADKYYLKRNIEYHMSRINYFLSDNRACFKYIKSPTSPNDFNERQYDQDLICNWAKNFKINIDTTEGIPTKTLDTLSIKKIIFKTKSTYQDIKEFQTSCSKINSAINEFNLCNNEIDSNSWDNFNNTIGILFIIFAFAVRLAITTKNVIAAKK